MKDNVISNLLDFRQYSQGFVGNGVHLLLCFPKVAGSRYTSSEFVDFSHEMGKVCLLGNCMSSL